MTKGPVAPAIDAAKKSDAAALNVLASPLLFSNREVVSDKGLSFQVALGVCHKHIDPPHPLRLLRARGEGPRRRACERRDELASPRCAIGASARGRLELIFTLGASTVLAASTFVQRRVLIASMVPAFPDMPLSFQNSKMHASNWI